ncbi:MAG: hypothetical protein JNL03_08910, partial [Prolixibacteraceae bacterium]|nr:hypothetical protein [Prolixibacteraceae bacterium]
MMNSKYLLLVVFFLTILNAYPQDKDKIDLSAFHSVSSHDLLNYAAELSSEKYKGRLSGSPGYLAAASWVADQLRQS